MDRITRQYHFLPLGKVKCKINGLPVVDIVWGFDRIFIAADSCSKKFKVNQVVDLVIKEKGRRDLIRFKALIKRSKPNVFKVEIDMTKNIWALTRLQEVQRSMRKYVERRA